MILPHLPPTPSPAPYSLTYPLILPHLPPDPPSPNPLILPNLPTQALNALDSGKDKPLLNRQLLEAVGEDGYFHMQAIGEEHAEGAEDEEAAGEDAAEGETVEVEDEDAAEGVAVKVVACPGHFEHNGPVQAS